MYKTKNIVLLLVNLFFALPAFCQDLKIEASYWDEDNKLYKVERKYAEKKNNSVLYVRHTDENSVCVKRSEYKRRDTLVVQVDYCEINRKKSKLEQFCESDLQTVTSSKNKDTATISFYKNNAFIGDTTLTGMAARNNYELVNRVKKERMLMILNNEIKIKPDSLTPEETVRTYYMKNNLVKMEVINSEKLIYSASYCVFSGNQLICKEYQDNNPRSRVISADSVTWNKDTSEVMWYTNRKEVNKKYVVKYVLNKNKLKLFVKDVLEKEITFVSDQSGLFNKLVASNLIYNDPLYSCELQQFETGRIAKIKLHDDEPHVIEYTYDKQKRVTEQKQPDEEKKFKRVAYRYDY